MPKPAAFDATYSDFKLVRSRKVVQLVFEVPIERADTALDVLGGMPNPAAEIWCGIARLKDDKTERPAKPKLSWDSMTAAQQAGILCNEVPFHRFLHEQHAYAPTNAEEAAEAVRDICAVASRSDIDKDPKALAIWRDLVADFRVWERALV